MINNYYDAIKTLGVQENASQEQIKDAFRSLSKKYHPDLYKLDNGEAFKRINQAYQYLKKYQDPPQEQQVYHQQEHYNKPNHNYKSSSERAQRTARNRARQAEKHRQQQAYYSRVFHKLNPYLLVILVLNILLAIDYLLPRVEETSTITEVSKVNNWLTNTYYQMQVIEFETGEKIYLYNGKNLSSASLNHRFTYRKTMLFRQQMYLFDEDRSLKLNVSYNVIKVFGFIVVIQLLALWRYFASKDNYVKLNAIAVIGFFILLQVVLLIIR